MKRHIRNIRKQQTLFSSILSLPLALGVNILLTHTNTAQAHPCSHTETEREIQTKSQIRAALPTIMKNERYTSVRQKMLRSGWQPHRSKYADTCMTGDARCQGRPEMEACSGVGLAPCKFIWKKDGLRVGICTTGEDATFNGFCDLPK